MGYKLPAAIVVRILKYIGQRSEGKGGFWVPTNLAPTHLIIPRGNTNYVCTCHARSCFNKTEWYLLKKRGALFRLARYRCSTHLK